MQAESSGDELIRLFRSTKIGELPIKSCPVLRPDQTVGEAVAAMREQRRGTTLVCEGDRIVGIFTERDWLRLVDQGGPRSQPLSDVMTRSPQTLSVDDPVQQAVALMDRGRYRRIAVVDPDGKPLGIIDVKTIVHFIVEHIPEAVYTQASRSQTTAEQPEGA